MPVYQNFGPGLGAGISDGVANFIGARRQRRFDDIQAQQAQDEHIGHILSNAVNYGMTGIDPTGPKTAAPAPVHMAPPTTTAQVDPEAFKQLLTQHFATPGTLPGVSTTPTAPSRRAVGEPSSLDPSAGFAANLSSAIRTRAGAGAVNLPGRNAAQPTVQSHAPTAPPSADPVDELGLPTSRVTIPGVGSFDPFYGLRRQLMVKQYEKQIDTDAAVDQALRTGVITKNQAEAYKASREASVPMLGDAGYAGATADVAGAKARAEALATLPIEMQKMVTQGRISLENALTVGQQRGGIEATLQGNQQTFTAGQNNADRFQRTQLQQSGQAGALINALTEQRNREGASLTAGLARRINGVLPSTGVLAPAPAPVVPGTVPPAAVPPASADTPHAGPFGDLIPKRKP